MYQIDLPESVQKQLDEIPKKKAKQIVTRILALANNPRPRGVKKTKGVEDTYHIWVGRSYRVVYEVHDKRRLVVVMEIAHKQRVKYKH